MSKTHIFKPFDITYYKEALSAFRTPNVLVYQVRRDLEALGIPTAMTKNADITCIEDTVRVTGLTANDAIRQTLTALTDETNLKTKSTLKKRNIYAVNLSGLGDSGGQSHDTTVTALDRNGDITRPPLETALPRSSGTNNNELSALFKPNEKVTSSASYRRMNEKGRLTGDEGTSSKSLQVDPNTSDDDLYEDLQSKSNTPQIDEQELSLETPKSQGTQLLVSLVPRDSMDASTEKVFSEVELRAKTDAYEVTNDGLKKKIAQLEEKIASMERDRQVVKAYLKNATDIFS